MKSICLFCSLSSFGTGMPISTYRLAVGLADRGVRVVLPGEGELAERLRGAGVDVAVIPFERLKRDFWKRPWLLPAWALAGWRLLRYIRVNDIGIAHFSDVIDAPFYPFARIAGAKTVAHVRVCAGSPTVRRLYRVWAHLFCSRLVTVSHFVKRRYGFGRKATVVYNPGPDRKVFDPKRYTSNISTSNISTNNVNTNNINTDNVSTNNINTDNVSTNNINTDNISTDNINTNNPINNIGVIDKDCPLVIAVSSFRRDKGLHNFVEIATGIAALRRGAARFMIVGGMVSGHEGYYHEVMESVRRAGLGGALTVTGNVRHEGVAAFLSGAAVFVHAPDWEEALGGAVLEAMAMGAVVVAYDSGGVGECFQNGVSGYLVGKGDNTKAAAQAVSLLNNPNLRQNIAANAKKYLNEKFTQESYINGILDVYDKISIKSLRASLPSV